MSIKSKIAKLSFSPSKANRVIKFGAANHLYSERSTLVLGGICRKIVEFILRLYADADVKAYLDRHGGTLFDLILRAVKVYISEK